jgi:uncharacterized protein (UPF0333 family)
MPPKKETNKEAPKMSWKDHLAEVYAAGKKKDSSYKYSQRYEGCKSDIPQEIKSYLFIYGKTKSLQIKN